MENNKPVYVPPLNPVGSALRPEWDQRLVIDAALGTPEVDILEMYELQAHQLKEIYADPVFMSALVKLKTELAKSDGGTFRLKCKLQAEAMLERNWELAHSDKVDPKVQQQIIANTVRWAGYDIAQGAGGGAGSGMSITINLGSAQQDKGITVEGERV